MDDGFVPSASRDLVTGAESNQSVDGQFPLNGGGALKAAFLELDAPETLGFTDIRGLREDQRLAGPGPGFNHAPVRQIWAGPEAVTPARLRGTGDGDLYGRHYGSRE